MKDSEQLINNISKGKNLTYEESKKIFLDIMSGNMKEELIYNFLTQLSTKGETSEEIAGGVYVLREKAVKVKAPEDIIDTCGTGGDGKNTLNISTASALFLASMGVKVAKHGNKALSSKCGSADVLERLKININLQADGVEKSIEKNNFGFMFAPNFHSTMKYVAPIRKKIGKRTIFNMIGPLSSPALVKRQVVGVFDKKLLKIFANALRNLDIKFAWIVNSEDGLDEISPYAKTSVVQINDNKISEISIDPKKLNINPDGFDNLLGDDAKFNATKMIDIFKGENNDFSKAVCLNAAAGLIVAEKNSKLRLQMDSIHISGSYNFYKNPNKTWEKYSDKVKELFNDSSLFNFCFAPIHADTKTGELIYTPSYYYIGHFSKFIQPGAFRLSTTTSRSSLESTAFQNPDGTIATVMMNKTEERIEYKLFVGNSEVAVKIPAHAIQTKNKINPTYISFKNTTF